MLLFSNCIFPWCFSLHYNDTLLILQQRATGRKVNSPNACFSGENNNQKFCQQRVGKSLVGIFCSPLLDIGLSRRKAKRECMRTVKNRVVKSKDTRSFLSPIPHVDCFDKMKIPTKVLHTRQQANKMITPPSIDIVTIHIQNRE